MEKESFFEHYYYTNFLFDSSLLTGMNPEQGINRVIFEYSSAEISYNERVISNLAMLRNSILYNTRHANELYEKIIKEVVQNKFIEKLEDKEGAKAMLMEFEHLIEAYASKNT